MNGIDFPVARVLDGIDAAIEAGLAPVKINMVVRRGVNEACIVPMARWARETGVILRFIEYMDVGHSNGWRLDEVVPAEEIVDAVGGGLAGRARRPRAIAARSPAAGDTLDGARRVRGHLVGHPAVLPRLHAGAALGRGPALHVPVRRRRARPARAAARRRRPTRTLTDAVAVDLAATRRPLLRAALGGDPRSAQGRDVRDGRLTGRSLRSTARRRPSPQAVHSGGQLVDGPGGPRCGLGG